ncbi:MAG: gamma-glutamyltransferase, partial [Gammaproteobacteria bacterium]|nr:gamma-glutamyltransferase [Gammaproteobacteria bacterium]
MPVFDRFRAGVAPVTLLALIALGAGGCRNAPAAPETARAGAPASSQREPAPQVKLTPGVVAANPIAVEAGLEVLRAGGGAADAAVAVQAALGLVEPQS